MKKRVWALLLAAAILAVLLSACGAETPAPDTASVPDSGLAEVAKKVLEDVMPILEAQEDWSNDALFERLKAYGAEAGLKVGAVMWPIRTALSGKQQTPAGATELLEVFGKEESLKRLAAGIKKLTEEA